MTVQNPTIAGGLPTNAGSDAAVQKARVETGFRRSAGILMVALPTLVYYMWICVAYYGGAVQLPVTVAQGSEFLSHIPPISKGSIAFFFGWFGLQIALQIWAPGKWVEGLPLHDGRRLPYKMNGVFSFWFTMAAAVVLVVTGAVPATFLADEFGSMLHLINILAFGLSIYLYFYGRNRPQGETTSGKAVYDYFLGTALNPRLGKFDLKLFFEARPGLILWVLLNFSFAAQQYARHGYVSTPMVLVCFFHMFYVADYFHNEQKILSTMDIKHENFGWMLCWGDAVWVPFTYTLQAIYLVEHLHSLPWWGTAGIVLLNFAGYFIFRGVNSQKDRFRRNPTATVWGKPAEYITTRRGSLLLISGWWGLARHINYMGDLTMALAWCLPCLFGSIFPYFYFIYFTWLLVHREWRDDKMCLAKYGADWVTYRQKVPWRIVPFLY